MQDEVNERSVSLSMRSARMGAETLARTMRAFLISRQRGRSASQRDGPGSTKTGKVSMKELSAGGAQLEQATLAEGGAASFAPVARRYHVAYSVMKDKSSDPPRWIVFFKAKDAAQMEAAFAAYADKVLRAKEKPSVIDRVRAIAKAMPGPAKQERSRDQERSR